jgi:DNA transformation protein
VGTRRDIIDLLLDLAGAGDGAGHGALRARPMFGEYALYRGDKVVALVCGDELYVKPTAPGRAWIGAAEEAPPYPGAKPHLRVDGARWDEDGFLAGLLAATAEALPAPRPKAPRKGRAQAR